MRLLSLFILVMPLANREIQQILKVSNKLCGQERMNMGP
jgi:hypothetical protein